MKFNWVEKKKNGAFRIFVSLRGKNRLPTSQRCDRPLHVQGGKNTKNLREKPNACPDRKKRKRPGCMNMKFLRSESTRIIYGTNSFRMYRLYWTYGGNASATCWIVLQIEQTRRWWVRNRNRSSWKIPSITRLQLLAYMQPSWRDFRFWQTGWGSET